MLILEDEARLSEDESGQEQGTTAWLEALLSGTVTPSKRARTLLCAAWLPAARAGGVYARDDGAGCGVRADQVARADGVGGAAGGQEGGGGAPLSERARPFPQLRGAAGGGVQGRWGQARWGLVELAQCAGPHRPFPS